MTTNFYEDRIHTMHEEGKPVLVAGWLMKKALLLIVFFALSIVFFLPARIRLQNYGSPEPAVSQIMTKPIRIV